MVRLWQKLTHKEAKNPYESLLAYVHPLVIGAVDRSRALSTKLCVEILGYHMKDVRKAEKISNTLNSGYPAHSYPITLREACQIGLNAEPLNEEINQLLFELNEIYSEMGQRASTDFDERNSHDNSILNILEGSGIQIFFRMTKTGTIAPKSAAGYRSMTGARGARPNASMENSAFPFSPCAQTRSGEEFDECLDVALQPVSRQITLVGLQHPCGDSEG